MKTHIYGDWFNGKNILVTGGFGFIGSHLVTKLILSGAHVTIASRSKGKIHSSHSSLFKQAKTRIISLQYKADVDTLIKHKFDVIFHCAATTGQTNVEKHPYEGFLSNIAASVNLLESARKYSPDSFIIFLGSCVEYGKPLYLPLDESHPTQPIDLYGAQKAAVTLLATQYAQKYSSHVTVLRIFNVYGVNIVHDNSDHNIVNKFIQLAYHHKDLPVYKPGTQCRDFLYIDDLIQAILAAGSTPKSIGNIYNVGSGKATSFETITNLISKTFRANIRFIPWPRNKASFERGDVYADHSKFANMTGWRPTINIETGLCKCKIFLDTKK